MCDSLSDISASRARCLVHKFLYIGVHLASAATCHRQSEFNFLNHELNAPCICFFNERKHKLIASLLCGVMHVNLVQLHIYSLEGTSSQWCMDRNSLHRLMRLLTRGDVVQLTYAFTV